MKTIKRYFTKWQSFRVIWVGFMFVFSYLIYACFWIWAAEIPNITIHDILTIPVFCAFFQTLMMDIVFYKANAYGD